MVLDTYLSDIYSSDAVFHGSEMGKCEEKLFKGRSQWRKAKRQPVFTVFVSYSFILYKHSFFQLIHTLGARSGLRIISQIQQEILPTSAQNKSFLPKDGFVQVGKLSWS